MTRCAVRRRRRLVREPFERFVLPATKRHLFDLSKSL
jgi:hypothetical protein